MLKLSRSLSLPLEAVTSTFGILAVRGAGKSNTAAVMAEEMFAAGLPFVVVDPVGSWYGLRSSGAGHAPGLPIPIFGGKHGDLPLERNGGELIADLVAGRRLSCVLDLSAFESESGKKTFLLAFARRLYQRNEDPLHLFLEEADDYIPQRPIRDEVQLLRAWENLVRRGRSRGIGLTLITQRSAVLNKNVLTQIETLIAMRTTGPQDIAAVEAWVKYHQVGHDLIASLSSLADGEAWVWSPHFLGETKRVTIRRRRTFDSGATPGNVKASQHRKAATLADVDLGQLEQEMAATIARAKADDPAELRRRIVQLERAAAAGPPPPARIEVPVLTEADREALAGVETAVRRLQTAAAEGLERLRAEIEVGTGSLLRAAGIEGLSARLGAGAPDGRLRPLNGRPVAAVQRKRPSRAGSDPAAAPGRPPGPDAATSQPPARRRILNALAFLEGLGVAHAERTQLALLADARPTSGAYKNNLGALHSAGLLEYPEPGRVALTSAGRPLAVVDGIPQTTAALHDALRAKLPPAKWRILDALIASYPAALERDRLAELADARATSGAYKNNLGSLRSLGLIDYPSAGAVVARDLLFLETRHV